MIRQKRMSEGETRRTHIPAGHMPACRGAVAQGVGYPEGSDPNIGRGHLALDSMFSFEFMSFTGKAYEGIDKFHREEYYANSVKMRCIGENARVYKQMLQNEPRPPNNRCLVTWKGNSLEK